jgi:hypothetical protein
MTHRKRGENKKNAFRCSWKAERAATVCLGRGKMFSKKGFMLSTDIRVES